MYIELNVTKNIINKSIKILNKNKSENVYNNCLYCPVALVFKNFIKQFNKENRDRKLELNYVSNTVIKYSIKDLNNKIWAIKDNNYINLSRKTMDFIKNFDLGNEIKEFSFKVNVKTKK